MATREEAQAALKSLNPAPVFLEAYRSQQLPENLHIHFGPPEGFFRSSGAQDMHTEGRLIPILDDGNLGIITFYDPAHGILVQKDIESPQVTLMIFSNWQQYLADLLIHIAESMDDDVGLRRIAGLIGFRYFEELMRFFQLHENESYDEYQRSVRLFVTGIAA